MGWRFSWRVLKKIKEIFINPATLDDVDHRRYTFHHKSPLQVNYPIYVVPCVTGRLCKAAPKYRRLYPVEFSRSPSVSYIFRLRHLSLVGTFLIGQFIIFYFLFSHHIFIEDRLIDLFHHYVGGQSRVTTDWRTSNRWQSVASFDRSDDILKTITIENFTSPWFIGIPQENATDAIVKAFRNGRHS